jgi:transcriptional repressor NrdR
MRCPYCQSEDTQVKDSRPAEDGAAIRRRRVCPDCGGRFTTFERVQLRDLVVVKKSGRKVPFDRDKLLRSVEIAVRKRNVDPERIDRAVTGIVRQLESSGETEVASGEVGRLVMEALKSLDDVAYVRFASVYRNFREAKDFHELLGELKGDEDKSEEEAGGAWQDRDRARPHKRPLITVSWPLRYGCRAGMPAEPRPTLPSAR